MRLPVPELRSIDKSTLSTPSSPPQSKASIEEERRYTIEATLVRCMKARKAMRAEELEFVVRQMPNLFFIPTKEIIRKCVKALENRDYLQRDSSDPNLLIYVP